MQRVIANVPILDRLRIKPTPPRASKEEFRRLDLQDEPSQWEAALPREILLIIQEHVDDPLALLQLALTCKWWWNLIAATPLGGEMLFTPKEERKETIWIHDTVGIKDALMGRFHDDVMTTRKRPVTYGRNRQALSLIVGKENVASKLQLFRCRGRRLRWIRFQLPATFERFWCKNENYTFTSEGTWCFADRDKMIIVDDKHGRIAVSINLGCLGWRFGHIYRIGYDRRIKNITVCKEL